MNGTYRTYHECLKNNYQGVQNSHNNLKRGHLPLTIAPDSLWYKTWNGRNGKCYGIFRCSVPNEKEKYRWKKSAVSKEISGKCLIHLISNPDWMMSAHDRIYLVLLFLVFIIIIFCHRKKDKPLFSVVSGAWLLLQRRQRFNLSIQEYDFLPATMNHQI